MDGKPRVACVTPARRVQGREITTLEGLDPQRRDRWGSAFCSAGGSQCGFCTPGIILRLDGLDRSLEEAKVSDGAVSDGPAKAEVDQALLAHLCRCTGWQTIHEAWDHYRSAGEEHAERDLTAAGQRATIEGRSPQTVSPEVALGLGGFAADTAPKDSLIAVSDRAGGWVVGETLTEARAESGKVQGRRTTAGHSWPLEIPEGEWAACLRTTWTDAAYLETDASWCEPGGEPSSTVANGGAFGAKDDHESAASIWDASILDVRVAARELADEHDRPVLVLASREDVAERSPKRPPVAGAMSADGSGLLRVGVTAGLSAGELDEIAVAVSSVAPGLTVESVPIVGPPTSARLRAVGWAEAVALQAGATGTLTPVRSPEGAVAEAVVEDGVIKVVVSCGQVLDQTVLRSYCIGAAHMAWSWLTSEAMVVDDSGVVHDLTVRSFGVLRAVDMPQVEVEIIGGESEPVNGSDAVFAAVAAAGWLANDCRPDWPIGI